MIKLSKPSKMPCPSWSLQALDTCPGSVAANGGLVDACKGCYATDGNYRFSNVKAPRLHNREDWKREDWVADMVEALRGQSYFRWFDSGDMYDYRLARKILRVMRETPNTQHWLPTRMHKFDKFRAVIHRMRALPNVVVRVSSDSVTGKYDRRMSNTSTIIPFADTPTEATVCPAYSSDGKCGDCRQCWNPNIQAIAYPAHGRKMAGVIARAS